MVFHSPHQVISTAASRLRNFPYSLILATLPIPANNQTPYTALKAVQTPEQQPPNDQTPTQHQQDLPVATMQIIVPLPPHNSLRLVARRIALPLRLGLILPDRTVAIIPGGESTADAAVEHEGPGALDGVAFAVRGEIHAAPVVVETILAAPDVDDEGAGGEG